MKNTSKTLVFFGNERLVSGLPSTDAPVLRGLINDGYSVAAVISHYSSGQSRSNRELEVAAIAKQYGIPVMLPNSPIDIEQQLKKFHADAAILVAYGQLIPQTIIDIFPRGIINVHPSLLPKYRGSTPVESAIANGDTKTGISIMRLTAGMDEGPIYTQLPIALSGKETKFELYAQLATKSAQLLLDVLPSILDGSLRPQPQNNDDASYSKLLSKSDSQLDTTSHTAAECERRVRAHLGFPRTKMTIGGHEIIIIKAHVSTQINTVLDLMCKDGTVLSIDELIAPSGKMMSATAFLNGYAAD